MARTNKKGGNTAGLRGWSAFTDAEKNLDNTSKSDGRANSSTFQKSEGSPQKIVPAVLGVLGAADLAYQGYKYYKGRKKKKKEEETKRRANILKKYDALPAHIKAKVPAPPGRSKPKETRGTTGAAAAAANVAKKTKKAMPEAGSAPKPKSSKKLTWAEAKKNDPNLGAYVAERKRHKKGSPEYKAVQAKINAAYRV